MPDPTSRYEAVSRRRLLGGAVAMGLFGVGAAACSDGDEDAFSSGDGTTSTASGDPGPTTTAAEAGGPPLPDGAELVVDFTFAPSDGGRVLNPYVAVWIEDASGALLETIALWYRADKDRYLNTLKRWYSVEQAATAEGGDAGVDTVSGATRVPGSYTVSWDGTDPSGAPVAQGDYFVCIEAAREHGPWELIRESIALGGEGFTTGFDDQGELVDASVTFHA